MNEPVLQTLKPLEEIEQEEDDEEEDILKEEPDSNEPLSPISKSAAICLFSFLKLSSVFCFVYTLQK